MVERVGLGGHESAPQTPGHYAHDDSASPQGDTGQIRLMHGSGLASRAGGAHVTPTPRQDGRRTWGDVTYPQVTGYFCATMDELGRTAGERSRRLRVRARTSSPAMPPGGPSATRGSAWRHREGASVRPRPARQCQPARARLGRKTGGFRGGRSTTSVGTGALRGGRRGRGRSEAIRGSTDFRGP